MSQTHTHEQLASTLPPTVPLSFILAHLINVFAWNGVGANPQSTACWAQLAQQQASQYFWINTNKSFFS